MGAPSPKRVSAAGRVIWRVTCTEKENGRKCGDTFEAPHDKKSDAVKQWRAHDKAEHAPGRREAAADARQAKKDERAEKRAVAQEKKQAKKDRKTKADDARKAAFKARERAASDWKTANKAPVKKAAGLRTRGIDGVPDGQKVTGLVYDNNGKRVPHEVLKKHIQGWD